MGESAVLPGEDIERRRWQLKGIRPPQPCRLGHSDPGTKCSRTHRLADRRDPKNEAPVNQQPAQATLASAAGPALVTSAVIVIYVVAFITGAIVMSFEMLGSRYLNPYFGSGIYTWASLISTVLAALTAGYFLGGWLADRTASVAVPAGGALAAPPFLLRPPALFPAALAFLLADIDDVRAGSLVASLAILP